MLTCVCAMQNVAEARKFKDFWRANLGHAAAAVTSFVNVNVINVSGMAGMSEIVKHTDV